VERFISIIQIPLEIGQKWGMSLSAPRELVIFSECNG